MKPVRFTNPQEEMQQIFSYESQMRAMLDFEVALADAQADLGIIPRKAADEIRRVAKVENIKKGRWEEETKRIGHPFAALIRLVKALCRNNAG